MSINWQDVITALGGDAVLLSAAAWLIQKLVSNRLTMAAEEFKIEIKAKADIEGSSEESVGGFGLRCLIG
jgi:hypothetical protein